ncbi:MAG: cystathionine gamma-synthase [Verrucomicrobiales bacterium]
MRDLLTEPLWQAEDLGLPIPDSPHAVSVTMPTWASVIGYEEEDPEIFRALQCGYPRFFCHPKVQALFEEATRRHAKDGETALVFASDEACARCGAFLSAESGDPELVTRVVPWLGSSASVLVLPEPLRRLALRYWRYTGEIVSSRQAVALLVSEVVKDEDRQCEDQLRARLASWSGQPDENGHFYASGMAAIFAAFRAASDGCDPGQTIQLEFPYVDVYCIQKHLGHGVHLLLGDSIVEDLERCFQAEPIRAVFCEIPCNPLTRTVDLPAVSKLCRAAGVPLIVDDTLGTVHNVDVYPYADMVTTSLTKAISGSGDVMAGSVWVCEGSPFAERFQEFLAQDRGAPLYAGDLQALLANSADFPARMDHVNLNAEALAAYLLGRSEVEHVYYPKTETPKAYETIRRTGGGYGSLLSIVLEGGESAAQAFYDSLCVSKGPSLGTNFTLACPYTLLAHYEELDWAEECGVSRNLIRVAVGMEPIEELIARFDAAFASI